MDVSEFAERLKSFFAIFDGFFMDSMEAEELLMRTKDSLENKICRNEAAMPIITALGGLYEKSLDEAKLKEVNALADLLSARKAVRDATCVESEHRVCNEAMLRELFGV
jgi:hypothetical protein